MHCSSSRTNQAKTKDLQSPLDTVSSIVWHRYSQQTMFFATSWDGYARCYRVKSPTNSVCGQIDLGWKMFLQHPLLCCDIHPDNILFVGMATGDIAAINLLDNQVLIVGGHDAPICGLFWLQQHQMLMSLGFDNLVRFWRMESNQRLKGQIKLGLKTHTTSFDSPYLVIGSYQSTISIVNLKNLQSAKFPIQADHYHKTHIEMFSRLNCSAISAGAKMIALGTMDGRTLHVTFKESYDKFSLDSFVSRSQKISGSRNNLVGQVNCVDMGCRNGQGCSFVGGTQDLAGYNLKKKSREATFTSNNTPTTALKVHPNMEMIIYAIGSDWTKGLQELQSIKKPRIYLSKLNQTIIMDLFAK